MPHPWIAGLLTFACAIAAPGAFAQTSPYAGKYGPVSVLGENEQLLANLTAEFPGVFLTVCGEDMDFAYEKWMEMLGNMEDLARDMHVDLNGLKTYLHIFWNPDGTVAHLAFYPRANTGNLSVAELKAFFAEFVKSSQLPVAWDSGFSHYGSAAFPTLARPDYTVRRND